MTTQPHELVFGTLPLVPAIDEDRPYKIEALAEGTEWGDPQPIIVAVKSLLQDGSLANVTGYDNRTVAVRVTISAPDGEALAAGETALQAEVNRGRNTLTWTPPPIEAAATVFDVVHSALTFSLDDLGETRLERVYTLTLTCLPFARSTNQLAPLGTGEVPPPPATPVVTSIDECDSATNWSSTTGSVVASGGAVRNANSLSAQVLKRTGPVAMNDLPYLIVEYASSAGTTPSVRLNGELLTLLLAETLDGGIGRYYYQPSDVAFTQFEVTGIGGMSGSPTQISVYRLARTNALGTQTGETGRQRTRSITAVGSVRAPARVYVSANTAATAALGTDALLYTSTGTEAFAPPLRKYRSGGTAPTADATTVSGAYQSLSTPTTFLIPAAALATGTYSLMARMMSTSGTSQAVSWTAKVVNSSGADTRVSDVVASGSITAAWSAVNTYAVFSLGLPVLPTVEVGATSGAYVLVTLTGNTNTRLDEAWLFDLDRGALSWLSFGTAAVTTMEMRPASRDSPVKSVWELAPNGTDFQRLDRYVRAWGNHEVTPGVTSIFTVLTGASATSGVVKLTYYPAFHTHVTAVA